MANAVIMIEHEDERHVIYNTGDQIWLKEVSGKTVVIKIITHDGVQWEYGEVFSGKQVVGFQPGEMFMLGGPTTIT